MITEEPETAALLWQPEVLTLATRGFCEAAAKPADPRSVACQQAESMSSIICQLTTQCMYLWSVVRCQKGFRFGHYLIRCTSKPIVNLFNATQISGYQGSFDFPSQFVDSDRSH